MMAALFTLLLSLLSDTLLNIPVFSDAKVIYFFHYYEPFSYFSPSLNREQFDYPGQIPNSEGETPVPWNRETHKQHLAATRQWQIRHGIEPYLVFVGEFGVWHKAGGAKAYLQEVAGLFSEYGWSWAYYSFRENDWDVADLELEGQNPNRHETELFQTFKKRFQ